MLKTAEVARMLGVCASTLRHWRRVGRGPAYIKADGRRGAVLYRLEDVERWIEERRRGGDGR